MKSINQQQRHNQNSFNFLKVKKPYKRKHNTRHININYMYTIKDITNMLNVHSRTISRWIAKGLLVAYKGTPYLIHGKNLRDFLDAQNKKDKINTLPYELPCFKCRASRKPLNNNIEIIPHNIKVIRIKANCCLCNTKVHKAQSIKKIYQWVGLYNVTNMQQIEAVLRLYSNSNNISSSI